jgi:mono/diheme cytochrome c family protein
VHVRSILTGILPLLLGGVLVTACDKKDEAKPKDEKAEAKADEKKADEKKADDVKADEAKADDAKADAKADDMKADAAGADGASEEDGGEPAEPADDAKADTKADDAKAAADAKKDDKTAAKADKKDDGKKSDGKKADKGEPAEPASKIDGKDLYSKKCASCHGASGKADTKIAEKNKVESWDQPGWKGKWTVAKIEDIVTKGKPNTKMKAFEGKLTPEEIKAVSKYAHSLGK